MGNCVILADGDFPQRNELLEMLTDAEMIICCDGAADKLLKFGRVPDLVIGDLDSVSENAEKLCRGKLIRITEQETNDLAKTFRYCRDNDLKPSILLGAAGGREDHLLGNLAQFAEFSAEFPDMTFYTDHGCFKAVDRYAEFRGIAVGSQLSFFSFDPNQKITATGVKYPLPDALKLWYEGTLNEAVSETVTVKCSTTSPVLIFFAL